MRIGACECQLVLAGDFSLDGGTMCGMVPKSIWQSHFLPDENNMIRLAMWSLLIKTPDQRILVDTGLGNKLSDKWRKIYRISESESPLVGSLHLDHAGGAVSLHGGDLVPTFPNARYHLHRSNWDAATNPNPLESMGYRKKDFQPLWDWGLLDLHDTDTELGHGIELIATHGHTAGHVSVKISDTGDTLFFAGDLLPTAFHCKLDHHMSYDMSPRTLVDEKRQYLAQAVEENWLMIFCHDLRKPAARIMCENGEYQCGESIPI